MGIDIHNYRRMLERRVILIQEDPELPPRVKTHIIRFKDECIAHGRTPGRVARYLFDVQRLVRWHGRDLWPLRRDDSRRLLARLEQTDYAPATKRDIKITLKKYVHFRAGTSKEPSAVAWIKPSSRVKTLRIPEEVLTPSDVKKLVEAADSSRDRTFIATLYEGGFRIGEILGMRVRHARPLDVGVQLRVDGKTGARRVRVLDSAPFITELLNLHPDRDDGDAPLWLTRTGQPFRYAAVSSLLKRLAKRAGLRHEIYPHLFRHSRATELANHLTEAQMNKYFGWVQGSRMSAVYVHMSGRDVDHAILRMHGLKVEKQSASGSFTPLTCPRCRAENPGTHRFCKVCGHPLTKEGVSELLDKDLDRKEADSVMDWMLEDPVIRQALDRKLTQLRQRKTTLKNQRAEVLLD